MALEVVFFVPFLGKMLLTGTDETVYSLGFVDPRVELKGCAELESLVDKVCTAMASGNWSAVRVEQAGTDFQRKVWQGVCSIPLGETRSYNQLAECIGLPGATRAVASAVAKNQVALAVPCHRVIRADGTPGKYRWGDAIKESLLRREHKRKVFFLPT